MNLQANHQALATCILLIHTKTRFTFFVVAMEETTLTTFMSSIPQLCIGEVSKILLE
jgi:hypothetical protein